MQHIFNFFLFILVFFSSSCQQKSPLNSQADAPKQKDMQVLRINSHSEPTTQDPRKSSDIITSTLMRMLYDGLTRADLSGKMQLSLAKNMKISKDKKTYLFKLRSSLWSNGEPVTAHDFERSWKTMLHPEFNSINADHLYVIKNAEEAKAGNLNIDEVGVKALDDSTLEITLEAPTPFFLELLSLPAFFPTHSSKNIPEKSHEQIYNGPFTLQSWKAKDHILLEKNSSYWDVESVHLKKIQISFIHDEHTELNLFENGELDWAGSPISTIPTDSIVYLKEKKLLKTFPLASTYWYKFNTKRHPFKNPKMRKAFAYAISRQEIIEHITQAGQTPARGPIPPQYALSETKYFKDGDIETARKLFQESLSEMGLEKEDLPPITLTYSTGERHQKISQALQQQWKHAFDLDIKLENFEWHVFLQKLNQHDFQVAGRGWIAEYPDAIYFLEPFKQINDPIRGGNNDTLWENREYSRLIRLAKESQEKEKRKEYLSQAERILMDHMPVAPFFHSTNCYLQNSQLKDVCINELCNLDFKWAYFH